MTDTPHAGRVTQHEGVQEPGEPIFALISTLLPEYLTAEYVTIVPDPVRRGWFVLRIGTAVHISFPFAVLDTLANQSAHEREEWLRGSDEATVSFHDGTEVK
jgi:hypothetical protein